jgi:copper chaperone CopZ
MGEATARLKTSGMHCSSCSMLVDLTLGDLPGVASSKTDHASGDTIVAYDPEALGVDAIIEAIRSVGYDAEPVE